MKTKKFLRLVLYLKGKMIYSQDDMDEDTPANRKAIVRALKDPLSSADYPEYDKYRIEVYRI